MRFICTKIILVGACLLALTIPLSAATRFVPNGSFEFPATDFASPEMDAWQKAPQPFWYEDPTGFFPWEAVMGQFLNTSNGSPNHIDNMEGSQAAYLFALPQAAVFQDNNTISGTNSTPSHQFHAQFEAGKSYALTVGLLGGGGGMVSGATFEISLYYRDAASNRVIVAATTITNSPALFPTNTHFTDFQARLPAVKAEDAWAGKRIGIQLASTVIDTNLVGGYWDIDDVRLTESVVPNTSFESPPTDFASPAMDTWQKAPQPSWYFDPTGFFPWEAVMGQFLNTSNGSPNHIDNMDGDQAAYLFALPQVAISQESFPARFEVSKSYCLTAAVLGGGGGMVNGATFEISLYYRDAGSNRITIAATSITNDTSIFPTNTHFVDFQARVPMVQAGDAWAGKQIGIQLASSIIDTNLIGGYWDIDNVRLTESVVPNASFESPPTDFASPAMDTWQKAPQPFWYEDPTGFFPWEALMGQFLNTSNGSPNHINNIDGDQAAYLFALPQVAISQESFDAQFEIGKSYTLTVGVLGGGGGMVSGATFAISLYYRDAGSNVVTLAETTITHSPTLFPTNTHFTDFQARVPVVKPGDPSAGRQIGIQLASTIIDTNLIGGYWDIDNVQLQTVQDPVLEQVVNNNQQFEFTLDSAPGRYEVVSSPDVTLPVSSWTSLGVFTNQTGRLPLSDALSGNRFYQVRTSP